ncbi:MAG: hypothetical protein DSY37_05090 [Hyperthermus sp.]|nr:MAG: hypothetical protein DSY37_05090 [Hyperthermus sp.]
MPIVYRCKVCGFIIDVFPYVGYNSYGVPTPSELMSQHGGLCPRCGHRLTKPSLDDIIVKPNGMRELLEVIEEARRTMKVGFRRLEPLLEELRRKYSLAPRIPEALPAAQEGLSEAVNAA